VRKLTPEYSTAGSLQTVDDFCHAPGGVRRHKQVNVVRHHFHSFDEYAVLLCRGIQNMLSSLFNVTDKNFAAVLWAPDDVIRQVEYGTSVLGVAAVFWLHQKHSHPADIYLSQFGQFQAVVRLTCRLKATVRRLFRYRSAEINGPVKEAPLQFFCSGFCQAPVLLYQWLQRFTWPPPQPTRYRGPESQNWRPRFRSGCVEGRPCSAALPKTRDSTDCRGPSETVRGKA